MRKAFALTAILLTPADLFAQDARKPAFIPPERVVCAEGNRVATMQTKALPPVSPATRGPIEFRAKFYDENGLIKLGADDAADISTEFTIIGWPDGNRAKKDENVVNLNAAQEEFCAKGILPTGLKKVGTINVAPPSPEPERTLPPRPPVAQPTSGPVAQLSQDSNLTIDL